MNCLNCEKLIEKFGKKFCSSSCSATYTNKLKPKRSEESRRRTSESMKGKKTTELGIEIRKKSSKEVLG